MPYAFGQVSTSKSASPILSCHVVIEHSYFPLALRCSQLYPGQFLKLVSFKKSSSMIQVYGGFYWALIMILIGDLIGRYMNCDCSCFNCQTLKFLSSQGIATGLQLKLMERDIMFLFSLFSIRALKNQDGLCMLFKTLASFCLNFFV